MLTFTCEKEIRDKVIEEFIQKLAKEIKDCELQTLAGDYCDRDLTDQLEGLIEIGSDYSFVFDKDDLLGEEPYGVVDDFYEGLKQLLGKIKRKFRTLEIDGYIFVNFIQFDNCYREGVKATKDSVKIQYIRQLPCIRCGKWAEGDDIILRLDEAGRDLEDDGEFASDDDYEELEVSYPRGVFPQAYDGEAAWCICLACV